MGAGDVVVGPQYRRHAHGDGLFARVQMQEAGQLAGLEHVVRPGLEPPNRRKTPIEIQQRRDARRCRPCLLSSLAPLVDRSDGCGRRLRRLSRPRAHRPRRSEDRRADKSIRPMVARNTRRRTPPIRPRASVPAPPNRDTPTETAAPQGPEKVPSHDAHALGKAPSLPMRPVLLEQTGRQALDIAASPYQPRRRDVNPRGLLRSPLPRGARKNRRPRPGPQGDQDPGSGPTWPLPRTAMAGTSRWQRSQATTRM